MILAYKTFDRQKTLILKTLVFRVVAVCMGISSIAPFSLAGDDIGGAFRLINQHGIITTDKDLKGKPVLLYFGFTSCLHICPTDLSKMAWLAKKLEQEKKIEITPVFITLDPERDTMNKLANYITQFHPRFVGLTGPMKSIVKAADKYHVYFKKIPIENSYVIDHSTFMFLLGENGEYLMHFGNRMNKDNVLKKISHLLDGNKARQ